MAYTGTIVELPIGVDGLTGNKNLSQVRITQLLDALNLTYESGTLQKEGGTSKYNSSAISGTPRVIAGHDWFPSDAIQRMIIITDDGKMFRDTGSGTFATTLKSGLSLAGQVPVFAEGGIEAAGRNRKLFAFTGNNAVQVLSGDGLTTSDISQPPADWTGTNQPTAGFLHEGRLVGLGNSNDPHRVYFSLPADHEDFLTTVNTISVYPGEGEALVAGISFKGAAIVAKKPRGIYLIDTSNPDITKWRVIRLTSAIGMPSALAFAVVDDDIVLMDAGGNFQLLSAVTQFGDVESRNLSTVADFDPFMRENINFAQLKEVRGVYYPAKREAHFAVAGIGATTNTRRVVLDFNRQGIVRFRFSDRDVAESIWMRKDGDSIPRPVYGDNAGFVRLMDQDTRSHDGVGYNGQFQIPHTDLSFLDVKFGTIRKLYDFLELVNEPKGNFNLNVDVLLDGDITETLTFNLGQTGSTLGSFVLDTDVLATNAVVNKKRVVHGSGRRLSLIGRNNGAGQDFSLARFFLHFRPGDERL